MAPCRAASVALLVGRELRHVVATQDVVDELAVSIGDQRADVVERVPAVLVAGVLRRNDQVDAVRAVTDLVLDPLQVDLELFGRVGNGTEYAETTRFRHGGNDVTAVAEREDRELDTQHLGGGGLHRNLLNDGRTRSLLPLGPRRHEATIRPTLSVPVSAGPNRNQEVISHVRDRLDSHV